MKKSCREIESHGKERKVRSRDGKPFPTLFASLCVLERTPYREVYEKFLFTVLAFALFVA